MAAADDERRPNPNEAMNPRGRDGALERPTDSFTHNIDRVADKVKQLLRAAD